jgi:hypothetical protein
MGFTLKPGLNESFYCEGVVCMPDECCDTIEPILTVGAKAGSGDSDSALAMHMLVGPMAMGGEDFPESADNSRRQIQHRVAEHNVLQHSGATDGRVVVALRSRGILLLWFVLLWLGHVD